jgi:pyridoxamine 5'-phosphate oxidase-like protein
MGKTVELADVAAQLEVYGRLATLVTVNLDGSPHIGTVEVRVGPAGLEFAVGPSTRTNIRANPSVSLSWLRDGDDYQLIIDGVAVVVDDRGPDGLHATEVAVRSGILHRLAGRSAGDSCRHLGAAQPDVSTV